MPTNLNALIRYKTIDSCLNNYYQKTTIDYLIEKCSEALTDSLGKNTSISERTIRNDIRVMRSDILGFNAPIVFENDQYRYSEENYSLFSISIGDLELLKDIQSVIVENFNNIESTQKHALVMKLSEITKQKIPEKCIDDSLYNLQFQLGGDSKQNKGSLHKYSGYPKLYKLERNWLTRKYKSVDLKNKEYFKWEFILGAL